VSQNGYISCAPTVTLGLGWGIDSVARLALPPSARIYAFPPPIYYASGLFARLCVELGKEPQSPHISEDACRDGFVFVDINRQRASKPAAAQVARLELFEDKMHINIHPAADTVLEVHDNTTTTFNNRLDIADDVLAFFTAPGNVTTLSLFLWN